MIACVIPGNCMTVSGFSNSRLQALWMLPCSQVHAQWFRYHIYPHSSQGLPFKSLLLFMAFLTHLCHNLMQGVYHPSFGKLNLPWLPDLKSLQAMQKCRCSKQEAKRSPGTVSHIALETTNPPLLPHQQPSQLHLALRVFHQAAGDYCQQDEVHHFPAVLGTHHKC